MEWPTMQVGHLKPEGAYSCRCFERLTDAVSPSCAARPVCWSTDMLCLHCNNRIPAELAHCSPPSQH